LNTVAIASTNELKLRASRLALQGSRAERYIIYSQSTKPALLRQTFGASQTIENSIQRGWAIRKQYPSSLCIAIENGVSQIKDLYFDFAAITIILPDEERPILSQSPAIEIPQHIFDEVISIGIEHTTWGYVLAEHLGGDPYDPHKILTQGRYSRIDAICAGIKAGLMQINWSRYPSSPPQPLAPAIS
jgi:non-canonical (house-cleaning) NTP pyrophosphatase